MKRFISVVAQRAWGGSCLAGCVPVLALVLLTGLAGCQMPDTSAINDLRRDVGKLADAVATKQELAATATAGANAYRELSSRVDGLDTKFGQLTAKVERDIPAQLDRLATDLKDANGRIASMAACATWADSLCNAQLRVLKRAVANPRMNRPPSNRSFRQARRQRRRNRRLHRPGRCRSRTE